MKKIELTVPPEAAGERLDAFIPSAEPSLSRSAAARLAEGGEVLVNGRPAQKNYRLAAWEDIVINLPEALPDLALPEDIPLDIVFEDKDIIVINKPSGMVVHPAAGNQGGTLVNALLHHCPSSLSGIGGVARPGIVHRIDKDTSGLLVVAKNDVSHAALASQLKRHEVSRIYHALVIGRMREEAGTIDAPIGRDPSERKRMAVIRGGGARARGAVTHWRLLENLGAFAYIECELETGRTHQIRVHMSSIGHPLMGDTVYGGGKTKFEARHSPLIRGQCLVAKKLCLTHPRSSELLCFEVGLPPDFEALLSEMRRISSAPDGG